MKLKLVSESFVNGWQAFLEYKEFFLIIYWQIPAIVVHLHIGNFDKMLMIGKFGVSIC